MAGRHGNKGGPPPAGRRGVNDSPCSRVYGMPERRQHGERHSTWHGSRLRKGALRVAILAALSGAFAASPMTAHAATKDVAVCTTLDLQLTFTTHNLTALGGPDAFTLAGSADCTGLVSGPGSLMGNGTIAVSSSCAAILVLTATVTVTGPNQGGVTSAVAAGPTTAQAWVFIGTTPGQVDAVGSFAWLNVGEIENCAGTAGTPTMSLIGAFAVETT